MAFGIGTNKQKADSGFIKGKQREIVCQCWFTSKGKVTPLMLKIEDEDGESRRDEGIYLYFVEKTCRSGIKPWQTERFCIMNMGRYIIADSGCNTDGCHTY